MHIVRIYTELKATRVTIYQNTQKKVWTSIQKLILLFYVIVLITPQNIPVVCFNSSVSVKAYSRSKMILLMDTTLRYNWRFEKNHAVTAVFMKNRSPVEVYSKFVATTAERTFHKAINKISG